MSPRPEIAADQSAPEDAGDARTSDTASDVPADAPEPEPPRSGDVARRSLGPFPSLERACEALLESCDPDRVDCRCEAPRGTLPTFVRVAGVWMDEDDDSESLRVLRAGIRWALNGDGYWEHVVRTRALRLLPNGRVEAEARVEEITCMCCRSAHPQCKGTAPVRSGGSYHDYAIACRVDARERPWCAVVSSYAGAKPGAPSTIRFVGDDVEISPPWLDGGFERTTIWFPPDAR